MTQEIDWTKPIEYFVDGLNRAFPARVLCRDANVVRKSAPCDRLCVIALVDTYIGNFKSPEDVRIFYEDGSEPDRRARLRNRSVKREGWTNVRRFPLDASSLHTGYEAGRIWPTREEALNARGNAEDTVKIAWEETS